MPHMKVFNRFLRIGGDDVLVPLSLFITGRILWMIILILILYLDFQDLQGCTNGIILLVFLFLSILNLAIAIAIDCIFLCTSLRGTIVETEKRQNLSLVVRMRMLFSLFQILYSIVGIVGLTINSRIPCNAKRAKSDVNKFIFSVIICSQGFDTCALFVCSLLIVSGAPEDIVDVTQDDESELAKMERRLRKFGKWLQYYSGSKPVRGGRTLTDNIDEVANVFTKYFHNHGFLDIVPSDIVAGIILVRLEQRTVRNQALELAKSHFLTHAINYVDFDGEEIKMAKTLRRVATLPKGTLRTFQVNEDHSSKSDVDYMHFMARGSVFAAVIYNRIIPLERSCLETTCRICRCGNARDSCVRMCCCCWVGAVPRRPGDNTREQDQPGFSAVDIRGLNFVGLNNIGMSFYSQELAKTELVFISFRNDTIHKPFAIFIDHQEECIVITIRGTLSIEDCFTDVNCDPVEVNLLTYVEPQYNFKKKLHQIRCSRQALHGVSMALVGGLTVECYELR